MSGFNISINYPETIRQAKRIEQIAGQCVSLNARVRNEVSHIKHCWKGKSSDALQEKMDALLAYHQGLETMLNGVAHDMKYVANQMKEADEASSIRIRQIEL